MPIYQCAAPVGLLTRDMKTISPPRSAARSSFRLSGRSEPRHATRAVRTRRVTVLLDGKPIVDARGTDVSADGVARFDRSGMIRLVAGVPQRRHVLTLGPSDLGLPAYVFTLGP